MNDTRVNEEIATADGIVQEAILLFSEGEHKGRAQWFSIRKSRVEGSEEKVTTKYVVPEYFHFRGGTGPDDRHSWSCAVGETIFVAPDGSYEITHVIPLEKLAPREAILSFTEKKRNGERQWQCERQDGNRTLLFILDRKFEERGGVVRPNVRTLCKTTRVLHRSPDGKFFLVAVEPKEEKITERAKRRRERKATKGVATAD